MKKKNTQSQSTDRVFTSSEAIIKSVLSHSELQEFASTFINYEGYKGLNHTLMVSALVTATINDTSESSLSVNNVSIKELAEEFYIWLLPHVRKIRINELKKDI
ncbi:hypothetical protein I0P70_03545 [Pontibacter sp. FD36]|uniref:hypothetical protein n=1 Tax=Pontibacter sp. FD36 TaxID=2789860 RepID=UPI0018AABDBD|nr:hypothetical protein [Pontibacter sp. FD36]MBF8962311.1 hypothetical protein [Pontibacter sp. FD36]